MTTAPVTSLESDNSDEDWMQWVNNMAADGTSEEVDGFLNNLISNVSSHVY